MTPVGFEPTQLALVELESTPLDHSGKVSLGCRWAILSCVNDFASAGPAVTKHMRGGHPVLLRSTLGTTSATAASVGVWSLHNSRGLMDAAPSSLDTDCGFESHSESALPSESCIWPRGPMDKASAYGAGDCRFESCRGHFTFVSDLIASPISAMAASLLEPGWPISQPSPRADPMMVAYATRRSRGDSTAGSA